MPSVSDFLIERMVNAGIQHVFGVPGDYVLSFVKKISDSEQIEFVKATDENHAGFAADAYARVKGIGCVATTYNVGTLKIANAVAGAYAERSPLVVISGSPGMDERNDDVLLHHMVRSFKCQQEVFQNFTCASTVLSDPDKAGYEIDRIFEALKHHKQPVYIELPRDIADKAVGYNVYKQGTPTAPESDPENLAESLLEVCEWIKSAKNPVIMAGVQVARFGLRNELVKFAERLNVPIFTTLLSKSVIDEQHPLFQGVYMGGCSKGDIQKQVENSDCVLMFGVMLTDLTSGFKPSRFKKRQVVSASVEGLKIKNHTYTKVEFADFCKALFKTDLPKKNEAKFPYKVDEPQWIPQETAITTNRFFEKVNCTLAENMAVVADIGDVLFGAADLMVHQSTAFLAPAFYTSMGFSVPGALGVQLADPKLRPIVLVGDGAFQMCCTELSTIVEKHLNPIVFVLNNKGYTTERFLLDGPFNDVHEWDYTQITALIKGGKSCVVRTETELEVAVENALASKELNVIVVDVKSNDVSVALRRMTDGLSQKI